MTQDFVLGQLRIALVGVLAYAGGRGWLTPADAGLLTVLGSSLGPIIVPWAWSIYANTNTKLVPKNSIAIAPENVANLQTAIKDGVAMVTNEGTQHAIGAKVVG